MRTKVAFSEIIHNEVLLYCLSLVTLLEAVLDQSVLVLVITAFAIGWTASKIDSSQSLPPLRKTAALLVGLISVTFGLVAAAS